MKKILLPTDFSDNAWNAVSYALQLFKNTKCTFYLINTYTPVIYNAEFMESSMANFAVMDAMKENSEKRLSETLEKIEKQYPNRNHVFSTISSFNTLTHEIEELCHGDSIDFIAMGTKGASGLKEVLFGSNTVHVIKNAKCPVLAIPSNFAFEPIHEVLLPSDYEVSFLKSHISPILDIISSHESRINFLHVSYGQELTKTQEENRQKLDQFFAETAHLFHTIQNQNIIDAITKFQIKEKINLLVMMNNKHSFFENLFFKSTIHQIGFMLNIPFLVIPSKK